MMNFIYAAAAALFTFSAQATFWEELERIHPSQVETIEVLKMTVKVAEEEDAKEDTKHFAHSVTRLMQSFPPEDFIWVKILEVYSMVINEYLAHPQELADTLKDKEAFFIMVKTKAGIQSFAPDDKPVD